MDNAKYVLNIVTTSFFPVSLSLEDNDPWAF